MKIYIISGLGADYKVLKKLKFPEHLEVVVIDWLIPKKDEAFQNFVERMAAVINTEESFHLLGYSFGGILVQEIHKIKPAEKVVILGCIKSHQEKSLLLKTGAYTRIPHLLPQQIFNDKTSAIYAYLRKLVDPKNPKILQYFTVRDPYYLKWSVEKVVDWKGEKDDSVIQILADKDIVFPIKYSKPDFIIRNATHLFPATKHKEVSLILEKIFG